MASRLHNFVRTLTWNDFPGNPTPDELEELRKIAAANRTMTVGMAGIHCDFSVDFGGSSKATLTAVPGRSPGVFALADTITVTATMDTVKSWRRTAPLSAAEEALLLSHEQGHFDLMALMARDCFIALMQLKTSTFSDQPSGQTAADTIVSDFQKKLRAMQKHYDKETRHGAWVTVSHGARMLGPRKEREQNQWEGFIDTAQTEERKPAMASPVDGMTYKRTILEVLDQKGSIVFK